MISISCASFNLGSLVAGRELRCSDVGVVHQFAETAAARNDGLLVVQAALLVPARAGHGAEDLGRPHAACWVAGGGRVGPRVAPMGAGKTRAATSTWPPTLLPLMRAPTTLLASSRTRAMTKWSCRTSRGSRMPLSRS